MLGSERPEPYGSFGNGAGMRASPAGYAAGTMEEALELARRSAEPTHDHPEGVKGAQAIAAAVFLARMGEEKDAIVGFVGERFGYEMDRRIDEIRVGYGFDETCQGSVEERRLADYAAAARILGLTRARLPDYAAAARILGITRARMTQVMNLLLLAPGVQEGLLLGTLDTPERQLRLALQSMNWSDQIPMP